MALGSIMLIATENTPTTDMWDLLREMIVLLGAAMLLGAIAVRFRQSSIVGYLFAGTLVGPSGLGLVADQEIFHIAELGVALLLFAIGLEFSTDQLRQLGKVPLLGGPLQVILTLIFGMAIARIVGLPLAESFVIGSMVALSSTASALRILIDRTELDTPYGRASLGILLFQDIAVVPLMLVVTALVSGGTATEIGRQIAFSVFSAVLLVSAFYVVFTYVVPRFLALRSLRQNRDLPILLAIVTAMGAAWVAHAFSLSPALGAFVAGVVLAVSPYATQIRADVQPLRTVLVTLFFAAVGMFADFDWLLQHLPLVAAIIASVILGKIFLTALATRALGLGMPFAIATGLCMAQIGEFSFVLAMIARGTELAPGILTEDTFKAMVTATIGTLLVAPYLVASAQPIVNYSWRKPQKSASASAGMPAVDGELQLDTKPTILILGFGPAGQRVAEDLLQSSGAKLSVVDMNIDNLQVAIRYGCETHVGDATQREILEHAGLKIAVAVIVTIPSPNAARHLVQLIREVAPHVHIIARCRYHIHRWQMSSSGAHVVVDEEDHVGHQLAIEFYRYRESVCPTKDETLTS